MKICCQKIHLSKLGQRESIGKRTEAGLMVSTENSVTVSSWTFVEQEPC